MNSLAVDRALRKLGRDLADARKRRRYPTQLMADKVGVTRKTLARMEAGSGAVSMATYAKALMVFNKLPDLVMLIDRTNDNVGLTLDDERLPQRIHLPEL